MKIVPHHTLRERSLFMAGMGTEDKVLCALKQILPHYFA